MAAAATVGQCMGFGQVLLSIVGSSSSIPSGTMIMSMAGADAVPFVC
jgi:hypothetical protein